MRYIIFTVFALNICQANGRQVKTDYGIAHHSDFNPITEKNLGDSTFDLYLLIGQSNMSGRGSVTSKYAKEGAVNVLMLNKENKWVPAKHPLHFDKPSIAGVGPGLSFGIEMSKKKSSHKIGLVPCAVGGTSIDKWKPGAYDSATKTHPYDDMLKRVEEAQKSAHLKVSSGCKERPILTLKRQLYISNSWKS